MVTVKGVWAVVIFAREPGKLSRWYAAHLGVIMEPDASDGNYYGAIGDGGAAPPVRFGIYPRVRGGGRSSPSIMINYKVADLKISDGTWRAESSRSNRSSTTMGRGSST